MAGRRIGRAGHVLILHFVYELRRFGGLLRQWRDRVTPTDFDHLVTGGSRRTPGLRREEVAELSDVSADYIKRLEQGRARPSLQVLKSLASTLNLAQAEYEHLCILTGHSITQPGGVNRRIGPATGQLLDRLDGVPVAVFDATWTLLRYNSLGAALCGHPAPSARRERNMAWRYFTSTTNCAAEPGRQDRDFEASLVADLRETASRHPSDDELTALLTALHAMSPRFTELWRSGASRRFERRSGVIDHPDLGPVRTDSTVLTVPEGDLKLLVFTAEPGSADACKLAKLQTLSSEKRLPA